MNSSLSSKVIIKLNRDTKEGVVKWVVNKSRPTSLTGSEAVSGNVYTTKIEDRNFRLYKYLYRYYHDEDRFDLLDDYRLEFIDGNGVSEWTFPSDRAIEDLYDTVRFKTSNVEGFFDKYLTEEEKKDSGNDSSKSFW